MPAASAHRILVVDDTSANRRLYSALLESAGFIVHTANDGEEALLAVKSSEPSLVLLDYMMPRLDGIGVLCALRGDKSTHDLPVVMLTASAEPDHIDKALDAGANDYITKPVNGKILIARIKSMISANTRSGKLRVDPEHDALMADLDDAARVQEAQLPAVPVLASGWTVTGAVVPSGKIGGDLFDIVVESDGRIISFLLDVSGHGTASALVAAETRAEFRNLIAGRTLAEAFARLNAHMARRATGKFCCLAAVEAAENKLTIVNAGLPPVVILRDRELVASVWGSGTALGFFEETSYEETSVRVLPGDRIVLLSDGLTDPFGHTDDSRGAIDRLELWPDSRKGPFDALELRGRMTHGETGEVDDDKTVVILSLDSPWIQKIHLPPAPESVGAAVRFAQTRCPDWVDRERLDHGLTEAVTNAIIHGTLGVTPNVRASHEYRELRALSKDSLEEPDEIEPIELAIEQTLDTFEIHVRWRHNACPPSKRLPLGPPAPGSELSEYDAHGMGMHLIVSLFDKVTWDEDGLGLSLSIARLRDAA